MRYSEQPPPADLADVIDRVWMLESRAAPVMERIVPDGHAEIVLHLGDPPEGQPRSALIGQMRQALLLTPSARMHVFGLRLKPWGAWAITAGLAQWEATDTMLDLDAVVPRRGADLFERIRGHRRSVPARAARVASALLREPHLNISEAARRAGISARQLEREFLETIGLTPKRFAVTARLQAALRLRRRHRDWNWAHIATEAGFADQAHLVKAFHSLAGAVPSELSGDMTAAMIRL